MVPVGGVGEGPRAPSASDSIFDRGRLSDTVRPQIEQRAFAEEASRAARPDVAAGRDPMRAALDAPSRVNTESMPEGGLSPSTASARNRFDAQRDQLTGSALQPREIVARQTPPRAELGQRSSIDDARAVERSSGDRVRAQRSDDDRMAAVRVDSRRTERVSRRDEAAPAMATAAEDLRSRLKDESVRSADVMTEAATQRALRDYLRAG
jgi:hypothetical protein